MSKFKKGDIVRRVNTDYCEAKVGDTYVIQDINQFGSLVLEDLKGGYVMKNFELVKPAAVMPEGELIVSKASDREVITNSGTFQLNVYGEENERLKNLLTSIYNCDTMCQVRRMVEEEINREEK